MGQDTKTSFIDCATAILSGLNIDKTFARDA